VLQITQQVALDKTRLNSAVW